ncbi:hypothetical protein SE956_24190 [Escherichia coli]|nr:hypothetical protein [Escherichia coli]MDW9207194.1 hypothetical protein [Escherichia coli]
MVVGGVLKGRNLAVFAEGRNSYAAVMADTGVLDLQDSSLVSKQYAALNFTNQGNSRNGAITTLGSSSCVAILLLSWPKILLVRLT